MKEDKNIVIEFGDLQETEDQLGLDQLLDLPNPIEQTHNRFLKELLEKYFPNKNYFEQLLNATQPELSNNPDEVEKWEAEAILKRKQKMPIDSNVGYLIRLLYEETFSVQQFQGEKFGTKGITTGGLLSHHLFLGLINGISIENIPKLDLNNKTFAGEFKRLVESEDYEQLEKLVTLAVKMSFPSNYYLPGHALRIQRIMLKSKICHPDKTIENTGYRILKIIHQNSNLLKENQDTNLLQACETTTPFNLLVLIKRLWGILGHAPGVLFHEGGVYKSEEDPQLIKALERLIQFRIHPDTQILYKYFSPSGYINEE